MTFIAPNLSQIVGSTVAAKLMGNYNYSWMLWGDFIGGQLQGLLVVWQVYLRCLPVISRWGQCHDVADCSISYGHTGVGCTEENIVRIFISHYSTTYWTSVLFWDGTKCTSCKWPIQNYIVTTDHNWLVVVHIPLIETLRHFLFSVHIEMFQVVVWTVYWSLINKNICGYPDHLLDNHRNVFCMFS